MNTEQNPQSVPVVETKPKTKMKTKVAKVIAGLLLLVITFGAGWQTGHKGFVFVPKSFQVVNQNTLPQTVDYSLLTDALNILNTNYINKPIDQQKALYGAISGAVNSLGDPYTEFFPPQDLQNFETTLKGSFDGIGAEVGETNGNIVIIAPLDGNPAQKAGLRANDIIAAVNGQSTSGWTVDQAVNQIRGQKGTTVTLTIVRGSDKPFTVKIVRDTIVVKSVKWSYQNVKAADGTTKKIAVVTISQFGDDTTPLFTQAAADIVKNNVDGIVLDLRNNPGGYLQSAVDVASNWVNQGDIVVSEDHSDGSVIKYNAEGGNKLSGIKTVILMNGGTASAAEILSGALHDHKFAELIGEKSFGKGSVQEVDNLNGGNEKDGSAIKVTIAKWVTPGGVNLNHNGLNPDVPVTLTEQDIAAGKDPQMDKALEEVIK